MDKTLYNAAQSGHLILTVNKRLARNLVDQYDRVQQGSGLSAWVRPAIMSYTAWLSRCGQQLAGLPVFLNRAQLQHVWEQIIEDDIKATGTPLLQVSQTARRAQQAHQLLTQHATAFSLSEAAEDQRAFLRWREAWQTRAAQNNWHDPIELPTYLCQAVAAGRVKLPDNLILAGFDEIPPDLKRLLTVIKEAGTAVDLWQPPVCPDVQSRRIVARDRQEEIRECARWTRSLLTARPGARIGIIVPQLESYRAELVQIFTAELAPQTLLAGDRHQTAFNCSLGQSLSAEGVIHAALKLLHVSRDLDHNAISWLLCTPYLGNATAEAADRALLDREIKNARNHLWTLTRLEKTARGLAGRRTYTVAGFLESLKTMVSEQREGRRRRPGDWAERFTLYLQKLGWPGDRTLSSREYQAIEHFRGALGELASLDGVSGPLERSVAVKHLTRIVSNLEFQPEGADAPVQVLGLLESGGLAFDALWLLGMTDTALPSPPNPNPFIPLPLQRKHLMKRSDIAREYLFAEQLVARLFRAAPDIVASWPAQESGAEQRPSPFIMNVPQRALALTERSSPDYVIWRSRPQLDRLQDDTAPGIHSRKAFAGGTGIIRDQAICPFRAFAHHRLRAEQLETPDLGIDSMARGTLAHAALEFFWLETGDQETLLKLDSTALRQQVKASVTLALERHERERRCDIPARQRAIEARRLQTILLHWLSLESRRAHFRVAEAETIHQITVGTLTIRTRIDRIDELDDGTCAIIDYKTGRPDPTQWLDKRMTEPQLPLYCLSLPPDRIGAVMFAEVRSRASECRFRGVARDVDGWPGARSRKLDTLLNDAEMKDFDAILSHWQTSLTALGDAFVRGDAVVDPVESDLACKYCDLTGLCRILDQGSAAQGGDDD